MGKSEISAQYRSGRYHESGVTNVLRALYFKRSAETILRNGPRILAACESVRREIEQERAHQEMATEDVR